MSNSQDEVSNQPLGNEDMHTGPLTMKVEPEDYVIETSPVKLESLCRMCTKPQESSCTPSPELTCQLNKFFGINILSDDGLPRGVCCSCSEELSHWEQVRSRVEQAQTCLKQIRDDQTISANSHQNDNIQESDTEICDESSLGLQDNNDEDHLLESRCTLLSNSPMKFTVLPNTNIPVVPNSTKLVDKRKLVPSTTKSVKRPVLLNNINPTRDTVFLLPNLSKLAGKTVLQTVGQSVLKNSSSTVGQSVLKHSINAVGVSNTVKPTGSSVLKLNKNTAGHNWLSNSNKSPIGRTVFIRTNPKIVPAQNFTKQQKLVPFAEINIKCEHSYSANYIPESESSTLIPSVNLPTSDVITEAAKLPGPGSSVVKEGTTIRSVPSPLRGPLLHGTKPHSANYPSPVPQSEARLLLPNKTYLSQQKIKKIPKSKIRSHSPNNPYQCGQCPIKFQKSSTLKQHLQVHLSANKKLKKMPCPHCDVKFYRIESLIKHQVRHVKYPGKYLYYTCDTCKIKVTSLRILKNHIKLHVSGLHQCRICTKTFDKEELLKIHSKCHKRRVCKKRQVKETLPKPVTISKPKLDKDGRIILKQIAPKYDPLNPWICDPIEDKIQEPAIKKPKVKKVPSSSNSKVTQILYLPPVQLNTNSGNSLNEIVLTEDILKKLFNTEPSGSEETKKDTEQKKITKKPARIAATKSLVDDSLEYPCGTCKLNFKGAKEFMSHLKTESSKINMTSLPCGFCGINIRSFHDLVTHTRDHILHPEKTIIFQCDFCSKKFIKESYCKHHLECHKNHLKYKCDHCTKCFSHADSLRSHIKNKHFLDVSNNINQIIDDDRDLNLSARTKDRIKFQAFLKESEHYSCDICNYKFFTSNLLFKHYLEKHVIDNDFKCMISSKCPVFNDKIEFYKHLKSHSVVLKYFCPICDRPFTRNGAVEIHKLLHSLERPFSCQDCSKTYRCKSMLRTHIKFTHRNVPKLICEYCSLECLSKPLLKRHILTRHKPEDLPFVCDVCGKSYALKYKLNQHKYKHTNEKPFRCTKCNKGFYNVRNWRRHMMDICNIPEKDITYFSKRHMLDRRDN